MINRKYRKSILLIVSACTLSVLSLWLTHKNLSGISVSNQLVEDHSLNLSYIFTPASLRETMNIKPELQKLRINPSEYKFDWSKWLNLSISDDIVESNIHSLQQQWDAAIAGATYVRDEMPNPARIIILPKTAQFLVDKDENHRVEVFNLQDGNGDRCHYQYGIDRCLSIKPSYQVPVTYGYSDIFSPDISHTMFDWNAIYYLAKMDNQASMLRTSSMRAAMDSAMDSQEHFHEPANVSGHHDWRFFRGIENLADTALTIQSLMRAWSAFAASYNVEYWIAQGSALGYIWNGYSLPWDDDIDIQMPIQTLHRLAWQFNGTLFVQDPDNNSRTYYLDINPWYLYRQPEDGNLVDGKFIDTTTGSYIDISAISKVDENRGMSKTPEYHAIDDILPLRLARFEGSLCYVPRKLDEYLSESYPDRYNDTIGKWEYSQSRKAWIDTVSQCQYPIEELQLQKCKSDPEYLCPTPINVSCRRNDASEGMRNYALNHEHEVELWESVPLSFDEISTLEPRVLTTFNEFFSTDLTGFRLDLSV